MAKKESKLQQITTSKKTEKAVFSNGIMGGLNFGQSIPKKDEYSYTKVELENINYDKEEYPKYLFESIKEGMMVNPIILTYEYEESERGGRKFREKTGRYNIVDGAKRVSIYSDLFDESINAKDSSQTEKYSTIAALLLPLNVSDEEIEKIKETTTENKSVSTVDVVQDITKTKNQEVTYCYRYEAAEIPIDKIKGRDNKYKFIPSEVDELEKSIYLSGLMQPIMLLPVINPRTMEVEYEIQAGHKRTTAIKQLIQHAKEGKYENGEVVLNAYKTIPSLLIPMGATEEQVEKIYNETNILSRHMTTDDVFEHIRYFEELPSRPKTKAEYIDFVEKKYAISTLSKMLQKKFKSLGFSDWKNTKATKFLTIYYYGSDKCLDAFSQCQSYGLKETDIQWIVTKYKDFNERKTQDEILEKTLEDRNYLIALQNENTVRKKPQKLKVRKATENLLKQKNVLDKMLATQFDTNQVEEEEVKKLSKTVDALEIALKDVRNRIKEIKIQKK